MTRILQRGVAWAGLASGAAGWFISTSAGYAAAPLSCGNPSGPALWITIACILLAAGGGILSWPAWKARPTSDADDAEAAAPRLMLAFVSVSAAALFSAIILMQGLGVLMLTGCER